MRAIAFVKAKEEIFSNMLRETETDDVSPLRMDEAYQLNLENFTFYAGSFVNGFADNKESFLVLAYHNDAAVAEQVNGYFL